MARGVEAPKIEKLAVLKDFYIDEKSVEEIQKERGLANRTIYNWIEDAELLASFIENLDPFVMKYLLKGAKSNAPYMKMLLENIMGKVAVQKSELTVSGIGGIAKEIIKGENKQ
jgi:predicted DNA-binding protein YlxM (UPF0122 family)